MKKISSFIVLYSIITMMSLFLFSKSAFASAFQLWEQDGASIGNYHAGRAAEAYDASTAFYNPAGLIKIKNQQLVLGAAPIVADVKFRGTVKITDIGTPSNHVSTNPMSVTTQGGGFSLVPNLHYAAPISNRVVFGLSIAAPFGVETNYGSNTVAKYVTTKTGLAVIDISPSVGFSITDKLSAGFGFDAEHASAEFDLIATIVDGDGNILTDMDTVSKNSAKGWAYGYHLGLLYELSDKSRVGLGYQSQVRHHLKGSSKFSGILASDNVFQVSNNLKSDVTLPPTTTLSFFDAVGSVWDLMATVSYTQWSVINELKLQNAAGILLENSTNNLLVTIPQHFKNTWNISVGSNYHLNEKWMFRTGAGFDQSPSRNAYRNLAMPDSNRIALALGSHFQATKNLGVDFSWSHIFVVNTRINNLNQPVGDQVTLTNGSVQSSADVFGLQLRWDIV